LRILHSNNSQRVGLITHSTSIIQKNFETILEPKFFSSTVVGYITSEDLPQDQPRFVKTRKTTLMVKGRGYSSTWLDSAKEDSCKKQKRDCNKEVEEFLRINTEAAFFVLVIEPDRLVAGRDPIGVQPLYYGENSVYAALATNRRALWKLGIKKTVSFPPGHLAIIDREGFRFNPIARLTYLKPKPTTLVEAAEKLQKLLEVSIRKNLNGLEKIAVAFSGGLDSSLLALLAKKHGVEVNLIHVSLEKRPETKAAIEAADQLKLPLKVYLFKDYDVAKTVPKVVELVENPDPMKVSIGVPFYWAAQKTTESGFKVLLAGQGADELFGGYQHYVSNYLRYGTESVRKNMFRDIVGLHEKNIERDVKVCSFHNVELRLPFASYEIAKFAISLPVELKIEKKADTRRKLVLRKVAKNMGLPESITEKRKKAVQYGTGVNSAIQKIAKKKGISLKEYLLKA
ncbi:asparagine synthetase B, partial [Candidatus Bathyarchaeota archaeon]|nr:asparagine synthetase B [Candidatus Bathyarchaeota archaeon]